MDDYIGVHYEIDINKLKTSMDKAKTELDRFNQKISKAAQQVSAPRGMIQGYAGVGAELKKMGISATTTTKQFEGMNFTALEHTKIAKLTKVQMGNLEKSIEKTGVATGTASKQYDRLSKRLEHSQYQIRQQAGAMGDARRAQERWSATGMKAMFLSQTAWLASGAVIFGVLSTIRTGIQTFMDFNQGLVDAAAITQATASGFDKMREAAMKAFTSSTMGAKEATDALKILGQAGMDATDAAIALETVYKVTTATGGATTDVVKFLTTALNVWNLSAKDAAEVGNILGAALNYSKLEVEDLTTVFNYVASMAKSAGMSITDLAATLAVMANAGIKASTIGTGLRGVFTKLIADTPKFRAQLKLVGLGMEDVSLVTNDFFTVLKRLQDAKFDMPKIFKGMTRREAASLNVILEQGVERFELMAKALKDTTAVEVMFERSMRGMKNQIILTGHQIQAVFIDMLKVTEPIIIGITKSIQALIAALRTLSPVLIGVTGAFALWNIGSLLMVANAAKTTMAIGAATASVGFFTKALLFLQGHPIFAALSLLIVGYTAIKAAVDYATTSTKEFMSKQNEEIDDLRKLQFLMMDVNRTSEEKIAILSDYAKQYTFLLPLMEKETVILEDFLELSSKEIKSRELAKVALKEQEIARKESIISLMEEQEEIAKTSKLVKFLSKLSPYLIPGAERIAEQKKQLEGLRIELDALTGKDKKIIKEKPMFEFTGDMETEFDKIKKAVSSAKAQALTDLKESLNIFGITELTKTELLKTQLKKRQEIEAKFRAEKLKDPEDTIINKDIRDRELEALDKQLKAQELAIVEYNKKIFEINTKAAEEEEKNLEKFTKAIEEALKDKADAIAKIAGFEETYRKSQADQQKRAMKERLTESEYNKWLAKNEFEEEQANYIKRIADLKKFKTELSETKIPAAQLKPLMDDIDALIAKLEEAKKKLKIEDVLPYDKKDMVGGFKKGIEEMVDAWSDGYALMKDLARDAAESIQSTWSDIVYDNMIGELKSINDYWKVLKNAILRHVADIATKMAMAGIAGMFSEQKTDWLGITMKAIGIGVGVGGMAGGGGAGGGGFDPNVAYNMPTGHTGGAVTGDRSNSFKAFSDGIRMHNGGEVMRILKKGEYVMQDSAAKSIGRGNLDQMNRTGQLPQKQQPQIIDRRTTVNYIQAIDAASFEQTLREKGGRAIYDMSLNSYSAARSKRDPRVINR